jgi:hypothetical protein
MSWISRICVLVGITITASLVGRSESAISHVAEGNPKITIRLFNYAHLREKLLNKTKDQVDLIYRNTGLEVVWADCPVGQEDRSSYPACTKVRDETHLFLRIFGTTPKGTKGEKIGEALLSARIANIYEDRVLREAQRLNASLARILAHAIAHEVGHLLLGSNSHAPTGIMVVKWSHKDVISICRFGLSFTPQQAEFIRAEVQKRENSQHLLDEHPEEDGGAGTASTSIDLSWSGRSGLGECATGDGLNC